MAWRCHGELAFVGMTWQPELDELRERQELAERMGGPEKIRRQHDAGRLTVRERIAALLDQGSFREIGGLAGKAEYDDTGALKGFMAANFVTGTGRIDGRKVIVGSGVTRASSASRSRNFWATVARTRVNRDRIRCLMEGSSL